MITLVFAFVCAAFARQPMLASFADDSVSYLILAQVFSPWAPAAPPVLEAFPRETFYPPLFPLLLAWVGAAHDIARAYALVALLQAACLPLVFVLARRWLGNAWAAVAATAAVALLPALLIHAKAVVTEPLFSLLLLATFVHLAAEEPPFRRGGLLALLLAAIVLTRAVGLAVVGAYLAWLWSGRGLGWKARAVHSWPAIAAIAAYAFWVFVRPSDTADHYAGLVSRLTDDLMRKDEPWAVLAASVMRQARAMAEAWVGGVMLFWVEGRPLRVALAGLAGGLALAGLAWRFVARKPDAWMSAGYLATFLLWPFNDQVTRFLLPVLPVLVLYAFWLLAQIVRVRPLVGQGLFALLLASLSLPALAFIYGRASADAPHARTSVWYRTPDLAAARARAQVQLDLFADMEAIRALTRPEDRVMWVVPGYVALLADRHGVKAPDARLGTDAYLTAVRKSGADYVFLSRFNPRDTLSEAAWEAGMRALVYGAKPVHASGRPDGTATSVLLKAPK